MTVHKVRLHGRGGQGAVTAAKNLAPAIYREQRNVQAVPAFGVERRGAPVEAYLKFTDSLGERIPTRTYVHEPDYLIVMDDSLIGSVDADDVFRGVKGGGTLILNTNKTPEEVVDRNDITVATIDAGIVADEILGRSNIVNTVMLGGFASATDVVSMDNVVEAIRERFPDDIEDQNVKAAQKGYERTDIVATVP